jgi:hypothetical protein
LISLAKIKIYPRLANAPVAPSLRGWFLPQALSLLLAPTRLTPVLRHAASGALRRLRAIVYLH